jgi:hypothetical protein
MSFFSWQLDDDILRRSRTCMARATEAQLQRLCCRAGCQITLTTLPPSAAMWSSWSRSLTGSSRTVWTTYCLPVIAMLLRARVCSPARFETPGSACSCFLLAKTPRRSRWRGRFISCATAPDGRRNFGARQTLSSDRGTSRLISIPPIGWRAPTRSPMRRCVCAPSRRFSGFWPTSTWRSVTFCSGGNGCRCSPAPPCCRSSELRRPARLSGLSRHEGFAMSRRTFRLAQGMMGRATRANCSMVDSVS